MRRAVIGEIGDELRDGSILIGLLSHKVFRGGDEVIDAALRLVLELRHEVILLRFGGLLRAVLLQADDIRGVDGARTVVHGVEIDVEVEEHVFHRKVGTIGKAHVVFEYEFVLRFLIFAFARRRLLVIEHDARLIFTVSDVALAVVREHAELREPDDVAVGCGCGIERVEHPVHFQRGEHERVVLVVEILRVLAAVAARKAQCNARRKDSRSQLNSFEFHRISPSLYISRTPRNATGRRSYIKPFSPAAPSRAAMAFAREPRAQP